MKTLFKGFKSFIGSSFHKLRTHGALVCITGIRPGKVQAPGREDLQTIENEKGRGGVEETGGEGRGGEGRAGESKGGEDRGGESKGGDGRGGQGRAGEGRNLEEVMLPCSS